jgi:hypothetical protein
MLKLIFMFILMGLIVTIYFVKILLGDIIYLLEHIMISTIGIYIFSIYQNHLKSKIKSIHLYLFIIHSQK